MKTTYNYSELVELFEEAISRSERFHTIPDDALILKPDPASWSPGEIFEHIVLFNKLYLEFIQKGLSAQQVSQTGRPVFKPRFIISFFIKTMYPPYKLKMKTIAPLYPAGKNSTEYRNYLDELTRLNGHIIEVVRQAEQKHLDLNRIKARNPVFRVKMTLIEFILMLHAHQQRHFWQAEKTLQKLTGQTY